MMDCEIKDVVEELVEIIQTAILAGDWKVDGACDPELVIQRAKR